MKQAEPVRIIVLEGIEDWRLPYVVWDNLPAFLKESKPVIAHATINDTPKIAGMLKSDQVEIYRAEDLSDVYNLVRGTEPPYWSLVLYNARDVQKVARANNEKHSINATKTSGIAGAIRTIDPYLPQMWFENVRDRRLFNSFNNSGLEAIVGHNDLAYELADVFPRPQKLPNGVVPKVGGSATDFDAEYSDRYDLRYRVLDLRDIKREHDIALPRKGINKRVILTVGAGQYGNVAKGIYAKYGDAAGPDVHRARKNFPRHMALALQMNAETVRGFLDDDGHLIKPGSEHFLRKNSTAGKLWVASMPPHYMLAQYGIPLSDSDSHTALLAEFLGISDICLIKRTDGIYKFNPYFGFTKDRDAKVDYTTWREAQKGNYLIERLSFDEVLGGAITRFGNGVYGENDGSTGHLMEDSALRFIKDMCEVVNRVGVVHIAPWEMWEPLNASQGREATDYRHVVTDQQISTGGTPFFNFAQRHAKAQLRDAVVRGKYASMIVR